MQADHLRARRHPAGHAAVAARRGATASLDASSPSSRPGWRRSCRCATGTASRPALDAPPGRTSPSSSSSPRVIAPADAASTARSSTTRSARRCSAACSTAAPGAALFGALLVGVYFWVLDVRGAVERSRARSRPTSAQPALFLVVAAAGRRGARGCSTARPTPSASSRARSGGSPPRRSARGSRATCTTRWPRPCSGIGFAALALSRRIERDPGGRGGRGAPAGRGRAPGDAPGARDHRRAARRTPARRCRCPRRSPSTRGAGRSAAGVELDLAVEDVGELHPADRARARLDRARGARERRPPRPRRPRRRAAAPARRPRRADGGRRRRRLRGPRRPRRRWPAGGTSASAACASARVLAGGDLSVESAPGRGLRALGLGADGDRPARRRPGRDARAAPAGAAPSDTLPGRSVPGYTWQ